MIGCSKETESFVEIILVVIAFVLASKLDAAPIEVANHTSRSCNSTILRSNVDLETSSFVDSKLTAFVNWGAEAWIVLSGVHVVGIVLGIVNVLFGAKLLLVKYIIWTFLKAHTGSSLAYPWSLQILWSQSRS
jgi:hypothetical protein